VDELFSALKRTHLLTDERRYSLIRLPISDLMVAADALMTSDDPFCAILFDQHEITIAAPVEKWAYIAERSANAVREQGAFRLITFDVVLPPTLIGYMARISAVLAEAEVPIFPFAAFSRDHIFVPADRFQAAWDALTALIDSSKVDV
jgi:hypothetical protein